MAVATVIGGALVVTGVVTVPAIIMATAAVVIAAYIGGEAATLMMSYAREGLARLGLDLGIGAPPAAIEAATNSTNFDLSIDTTNLRPQRLRTNIAAFFMEFTDQQINRRIDDGSGLPVFATENAGKSEITGLEVELSALPTDCAWSSPAHCSAEYKEYFTQSIGDPQNGIPGSRVPGWVTRPVIPSRWLW